ncbi:MAG: hypothetical protein ACOZF0_01945, partial [Thermodesulfobacteriota bacterium]
MAIRKIGIKKTGPDQQVLNFLTPFPPMEETDCSGGANVGQGIVEEKKKARRLVATGLEKDFRRRPTLPPSFPSSTIGAKELN